jgi:hypothetical protein
MDVVVVGLSIYTVDVVDVGLIVSILLMLMMLLD